jgi:hypothetical protein
MAFKWDVNLGHMLIAVPLIIGGTAYIVTDHNAQITLAAAFEQLRTTMATMATAASVDALRVDTNRRLDELRNQVSGLPDQSASLHTMDSRMTRIEANKSDRDAQISELSKVVYQDHADLTAIIRANQPQLGRK